MRRTRRKNFIRCVKSVSEKQHSENVPYNAYAVCRTSTGYKGTSYNIGIKHPVIKKEYIRKEMKDHPQLTYEQAKEIVKQELNKNKNFYIN